MAARVKYAYDAGHQVASHTWNHLHLNTLNQHQLHVQFWLVEEAIYRITGAYPAYTRPPFGEYNQLVQEVADAAGATGDQSLRSYNSLIASRPASILTLNHEITPSTPRILPDVIRDLQAAGYRLTTLADCLGEPAYQWVDEPQERTEEWTCRGRVW
ncbi:glycoside hydrolase/deacetylase [Coprinellus micaceus]|uniref:Glycoside hydrolase/deacetylase n=1 Tax=Coprinellus micaceus TaxID=71717 RepID=A0A4Y7TH59_COPMI|nr:glycoside hydrolase/deacetylase [Coprinellus micaceus]